MTFFEGIFLGLVQGLTEFIPVSSTGHLILFREWLGLSAKNGLAIDAVLQLGTVLAVALFFRQEWARLFRAFFALCARRIVSSQDKILIFALLLGTLPAVFLGLLLEPFMEGAFRGSKVVAVTLLLGSVLFYVAEKFSKQNAELSLSRGVAIGFFQTLALFPGMSRSGATISGGLLVGLTREEATKFSFLLSFPILLGSGLLKLFELVSNGAIFTEIIPLGAGFLASFLSGLFAISFLLRFLKTHTLIPFAIYRVCLALVILLFL